MVHSAIDYTYSAGTAAVTISNAAAKAWVELLRGINCSIKWVDVEYKGFRTTGTIIFWQAWFISCAMKKKIFLHIVHVKTSE